MKSKVVIYARFSSHSQTEQSIEGQLRECYEFAKRNDYVVVNEYIDRANSGMTDNRPTFLQMIEDSKKKEFEYVLVYSKSNQFLMNAIRMKKENTPSKGRWDVFWSNADRPTMRYDVLGFTPTTGQWRNSK